MKIKKVSSFFFIYLNFTLEQNKWLKRFDTQLNEPTKENSIKVPRVDKPRKKKTLGTSVIKSSSPSLKSI